MQHGIVNSFKLEQLGYGTHDFSADTFKLALYQSNTSLTLSGTTVYTTTDECNASGYTAGGNTLTKATGFPKLNTTGSADVPIGSMLLMDFQDITFSSITGLVRGGMIYNTSRSNKAVALLDFGLELNVNGNLVITWPEPDIFSAIIRIK